jgi:hypothetical protein
MDLNTLGNLEVALPIQQPFLVTTFVLKLNASTEDENIYWFAGM